MASKKDDEPKTRTVRGVGDNSDVTVNGDKLLGIIKKIEKVESKKDNAMQELREEYAEAKALELDTKVIRRIVKERKQDAEKVKEQDDTYELYKTALGMLDE